METHNSNQMSNFSSSFWEYYNLSFYCYSTVTQMVTPVCQNKELRNSIPLKQIKTDTQTLEYLPNLSKYLLHQRWACICFMFERPEGKGTRIFRARDNAKWSNLLHGVWCTALPSFQAMYSLHSPVGWSHGNSVIRIFWAILHTIGSMEVKRFLQCALLLAKTVIRIFVL
jgi:hypothetical protein